MKPHAFVAMPFGTKPGADGQPIDFNRIYAELIRPALQDAGFEAFRADEEQRAGDIRADMFQELLVADLVLADLTLDNPNVWYELGVRHALRERGVLLVQGPRESQPFDIYTDRKLRYHLKDGAPDPATLAADRERLAELARATHAAPSQRKVSPVYALLEHLREPQWKELLLAGRNEFAQAYEAWARRMEVARQKNRPGDLMVLAEETPTQALRLEARCMAAQALLKLRQYAMALEQCEAALAIAPQDQRARELNTLALSRLGRMAEAREAVRDLTEEFPTDAKAWALAGRVEKEDWVSRWHSPQASAAQQREAAAASLAVLEQAIVPYHQAFMADPSAHGAGINSLTLHQLLKHLGGEVADAVLQNLAGGVAWAALAAQKLKPRDYWARASFAELALLMNPETSVLKEFRHAVAAADGDRFALDSTAQQLQLLRSLEFRPELTAAALGLVQAELQRLGGMAQPPRHVLLFSGHMADAPGRSEPRLPPQALPQAQADIEATLDALQAGPQDLALTQGASGGDLLFVEACQRRGVPMQLLLPQEEPQFIQSSVLRAEDGEAWRARFLAQRKLLGLPPRVLADELGAGPAGSNIYERCNLWLLYTALAHGQERVHFIALWDGSGGDGPGGTAHMYNEVNERTGQVHWLKPRW